MSVSNVFRARSVRCPFRSFTGNHWTILLNKTDDYNIDHTKQPELRGWSECVSELHCKEMHHTRAQDVDIVDTMAPRSSYNRQLIKPHIHTRTVF